MLYLAYGSNMDWERITHRDRVPSAQFLLRATLPDYKLAFTRRSEKQQTGTADVVMCPGRIVWGVVFDIDPAEKPKLDAAEGVNSGAYCPETVDRAGPILYRDDFQDAINKFIESYRADVPHDPSLQQAFIRKFDHLCA